MYYRLVGPFVIEKGRGLQCGVVTQTCSRMSHKESLEHFQDTIQSFCVSINASMILTTVKVVLDETF